MVMDTTSLSILTNPYLSYPTSLFLRVSVCRLLPVASWRKPSVQLNNVSFSRWQNLMGRAYKKEDFSTHTSSEDSSRRGKLIKLFKRIQIEISEGESDGEDYDKSLENFSDDDSSVETSVLEFLQQSSWKPKAKISNLKHNSENSNHKRITGRNEKPILAPQPISTTSFSRPPSNFVKKSPIPSPTTLQSNEILINNIEDSDLETVESSKIEGLKLNELKELAKQRGLKGYSKLKKSELIQLLKS